MRLEIQRKSKVNSEFHKESSTSTLPCLKKNADAHAAKV